MSFESMENIQGHWETFQKGSEPDDLVSSIKKFPTGWCTRNRATAREQLQGGDFLVYYSEDQDGDEVVPRLAIRMEDDSIAEIRGVAERQNIDEYIQPVIDTKLEEYGEEGDEYREKSADMKRMTDITKRFRAGEELTPEDLSFVKEDERKIKGFGYNKDPRIGEVVKGLEIDELREEHGFENDLDLLNYILKHHGDDKDMLLAGLQRIDVDHVTYANRLMESVKAGRIVLVLNNMDKFKNVSFEDLSLPENIQGDLDLRGLTSAEGLTLPENIQGDLYLDGLTSAEGLNLPENIQGILYLSSLTSADKDLLRKKYPQHANRIE
jgi:hypothetical protein